MAGTSYKGSEIKSVDQFLKDRAQLAAHMTLYPQRPLQSACADAASRSKLLPTSYNYIIAHEMG